MITVGIGDFSNDAVKADNPLTGDVCAVIGMFFWALQLTYEEKFVKKHNINPLNALGLEGMFSAMTLSLMLVGFYFIKVPFNMGQPNGQMEDAIGKSDI